MSEQIKKIVATCEVGGGTPKCSPLSYWRPRVIVQLACIIGFIFVDFCLPVYHPKVGFQETLVSPLQPPKVHNKVYFSRLCFTVQCALPHTLKDPHGQTSGKAHIHFRLKGVSLPTAMYQHRCLNDHHLTFSLIWCHLWYVVFVMCNAAHNVTMWTHFYFLFLCHMFTSGFEVICTVTSCLKGHLSYS
jgi:hypothetical protein